MVLEALTAVTLARTALVSAGQPMNVLVNSGLAHWLVTKDLLRLE